MTQSVPSPIRLLIVDDDELLRQTLVRGFQRQGYKVRAAARGGSALREDNRSLRSRL